jgi:hypothetical protein
MAIISYKNFWSLNTDEAIVSGILRSQTSDKMEILMPMNAQMKGIDLVLMNVKNKKATTIQVKGSRAYEPKKNDSKKYGQGNAGWFALERKTVFEASADFFCFLVYVIEEDTKIGRRILKPHIITIPTKKLQSLTKKHKGEITKGKYNYYFWVNPETKEALNTRDEVFYISEYLDEKGCLKLEEATKE